MTLRAGGARLRSERYDELLAFILVFSTLAPSIVVLAVLAVIISP